MENDDYFRDLVWHNNSPAPAKYRAGISNAIGLSWGRPNIAARTPLWTISGAYVCDFTADPRREKEPIERTVFAVLTRAFSTSWSPDCKLGRRKQNNTIIPQPILMENKTKKRNASERWKDGFPYRHKMNCILHTIAQTATYVRTSFLLSENSSKRALFLLWKCPRESRVRVRLKTRTDRHPPRCIPIRLLNWVTIKKKKC